MNTPNKELQDYARRIGRMCTSLGLPVTDIADVEAIEREIRKRFVEREKVDNIVIYEIKSHWRKPGYLMVCKALSNLLSALEKE